MKSITKTLQLFAILAVLSLAIFSCKEEDEGKLPFLNFKSGNGYVSSDSMIPHDSTFKIGINAAKAEDKDPLIRFNISRKSDGNAATTVFQKDLSGGEAGSFSYDYSAVADGTIGTVNIYTFTVTNKDGLTNQKSLTITKQ